MRKALVVDDTKNIRLMLSKCLELEGYHVSAAANGQEGLDLILAKPFDLIFLDIKLPELSGTEVLRRMRAANIQTPVIVITAYPTIKNAVECTRLGVMSYLQKPFTAERLSNILRDLEEDGKLSEENPLITAQNALNRGDGLQALVALCGAMGSHHQDPALYAMMANAYEMVGDKASAAKFMQVAAIFSQGDYGSYGQ